MLTPEKFAGIYKAIDLIRKAAIVALFAFIVGSMGLQIAGRIGRLVSEDFEPLWGSLEWTDEILRYVNIWVVFLGAGLAVKHSEHLHVNFLAVKLFGASLAALAPTRFDSGHKIAKLRAPLLFFHGDRDEIVPYDLGLQLFAAAPEPKTFETIRGAGHNDTVQVGGRQYFDRIQRFLDEVAPQ